MKNAADVWFPPVQADDLSSRGENQALAANGRNVFAIADLAAGGGEGRL